MLVFDFMNVSAQEKPTLIYIGDPMCSWCYGLSSEYETAMKSLQETVNFQLLLGGLRPFNKEKINSLKDFLKEHWEEVHARSGQKFGYEILDHETWVYDTEPSCRAVVIVREHAPEKAFSYFQEVQLGFYRDNKNPSSSETFAEICERMDIMPKAAFTEKFESQENKDRTKVEFQYVQNLGVNSFPTVILQNGDEYYLVTSGYTTSENIVNRVKSVLNN